MTPGANSWESVLPKTTRHDEPFATTELTRNIKLLYHKKARALTTLVLMVNMLETDPRAQNLGPQASLI